MSHWGRRVFWLLGMLGAGGGVAWFCARAPFLPPRDTPPRATVVSPKSVRVSLRLGQRTAEAAYVIRNDGGRDLELGPITSSCGCTSARADHLVVEPGGSTTLRVTGQGLPIGDRRIQLDVPTNEGPGSKLTLELVVAGNTSPPLVSKPVPGLYLGLVRATGLSRTVLFGTHEAGGSEPWLTRAVCTSPEMTVALRLQNETPRQQATLDRLYEIEVRVDRLPDRPGTVSGEVLLHARGADEPIWRLPVSFTSRAPVLVTPTTLIATVLPDDPPLDLTVVVQSDDPAVELDCRPLEVPPGLTIRRVGGQGPRAIYSVRPEPGGSGQIVGVVRLGTNHPEIPVVELPVRIRHEAGRR